MSSKIVLDSSGDLQIFEGVDFASVPLKILAGDREFVDDAQLIAVIAAAIAAFDNSGKNLVVRKVRRVNGWNNAARREQIYKF